MKRFEILVFLVLIFGCSDFEDEGYIPTKNVPPQKAADLVESDIKREGYTPIEKRKIVGHINDQIAFLGLESRQNNQFGFVFELQNAGEFKYLSVLDKGLICGSDPLKNCFNLEYDMFRTGIKMWYRISGDIKEFSAGDKFVGNPFVLTKAEKILSCPTPYDLIPGDIPLENIWWSFIGFIDENGKIYSHPSCEFPNTLKFKTDPTVNADGSLEIQTLNHKSWGFRKIFTILLESNKIDISIVPITYAHPMTYGMHSEKTDSLVKVFNGNTLDYVLENNTLKLFNPKAKLNAMFVAK